MKPSITSSLLFLFPLIHRKKKILFLLSQPQNGLSVLHPPCLSRLMFTKERTLSLLSLSAAWFSPSHLHSRNSFSSLRSSLGSLVFKRPCQPSNFYLSSSFHVRLGAPRGGYFPVSPHPLPYGFQLQSFRCAPRSPITS